MGEAERAANGVAGPGVVTEDLGSGGSIEDVAAATFRTLVHRFGVARAGLALTVPGGRQLRFISSDADFDDDAAARWCLIDAYAELPLNDAVRTGQDVVLPTRQALLEAYPQLGARQQPGIRSVLALTLRSGAQRLGGLIVYLDQEVDWGRVGPRLSALASEVSSAIVAVRTGNGTPTGLPNGYRLPADETAAALARRFLRETLDRWEVAEDVTYSALLCASEIVTNVIMHAACPSVIRADRSPDGITVEIRHPAADTAPPPSRPAERDEDLMDISGRGLAIVDAIAAEWGNAPIGEHVRWWFRLR